MKSAILSVEEGDIQFARVVFVIDVLLLARRQQAAHFQSAAETRRNRTSGEVGAIKV